MTDQLARLATALADRYRFERELGAGGMATVFLAEDLKHDRHVAIKVLRPDLAAALGPERFLREVKIAANLQHPTSSRSTTLARPTGSSTTSCRSSTASVSGKNWPARANSRSR